MGIYLGVELLGHMVALFNMSGNRPTVFHSCCIISHSHHLGARVPVSPYCLLHLLSLVWLCSVYNGFPSTCEVVARFGLHLLNN